MLEGGKIVYTSEWFEAREQRSDREQSRQQILVRKGTGADLPPASTQE